LKEYWYCVECFGVTDKENPYGCCHSESLVKASVIACIGICNTASLNIYTFNTVEDKVLVGINNNLPEWCPISEVGESDEVSILYGETMYSLSDAMRVQH